MSLGTKILLWLVTLAGLAGGAESTAPPPPPGREVAPGVRLVGRIEHPQILESSGLVASRRHPGIFWTHNDGGGGKRQVLCAMTRAGMTIGDFLVGGVLLRDWEDIAVDNEGHLFIGDIGNNDAKRDQLAVYELDEPNPQSKGFLFVKRGWQLRFPAKPFDCESLFVCQTNGYLISKVFQDERAEIYRFPLTDSTSPTVLEFVARLRVQSPVTGADISADGRLLGLVAHSGAFVFAIGGDPAAAGRLKPHRTRYNPDKKIEGCCFTPEGLLATAETRDIYLFTAEAFRSTP